MFVEKSKFWNVGRIDPLFEFIPWKWPQRITKVVSVIVIFSLLGFLIGSAVDFVYEKAEGTAPGVVTNSAVVGAAAPLASRTRYRCVTDTGYPCPAPRWKRKFKRGGFGRDRNGIDPALYFNNPRVARRVIKRKIREEISLYESRSATQYGYSAGYLWRKAINSNCRAAGDRDWRNGRLCVMASPPRHKWTKKELIISIGVVICATNVFINKGRALALFSGNFGCAWGAYGSAQMD